MPRPDENVNLVVRLRAASYAYGGVRVSLRVLPWVTVAALAMAGCGGSAAMQPPPGWFVRDLGVTLNGASMAQAINERGQILIAAGCAAGGGPCAAGAPNRELLWQNGKAAEVAYGEVFASALNDRGAVVGARSTSSGKSRAFYWRNGRISDLGTLGGSESDALGVNVRGEVVGSTSNAAGLSRGFVWRAGRMAEISPPAGRAQSSAQWIDDLGNVLGEGWNDNPAMPDSTKDRVLFLWRNGKTTELGEDPAPPFLLRAGRAVWHHDGESGPYIWEDGRMLRVNARHWLDSSAVALNDRGEVAGYYGIETERGFLWHNGTTTSFRLPGRSSSYAILINNRGQLAITAFSSRPSGSREPEPARSYVRRNARLTALPTLGGRWSRAIAMNNAGAIVGWSTTKKGVRHAVLWTHR